MLRATDFVDQRHGLLERLLRVVEELRLVRGAGRPALGGRAIVRDDHDQRVLEVAPLVEELEQPADLVVGVLEETGEHLHEPGIQLPCRLGLRVPVGDIGVVARELRVDGNDPELLCRANVSSR